MRHFFAYGDATLVAVARQSGSDPTAAIGKEIPQGALLNVPSGNMEFRVQYHMEYASGFRETVFSRFFSTNFSFDQGVMSDGATTNLNLALNQNSFRKLAPSYAEAGRLTDNFVGGQSFGAWSNPATKFDSDGDGEPDLFTYTPSEGAIAGSANGSNLIMPRQLGLHSSITGYRPGFSSGGSVFRQGERRHIMDVLWRANLAVGETYGLMGTETGLSIHTYPGRPSPSWTATNFYQSPQYYNNDPDWINIGAKYNLIGAAPVPEPNSLLAVALGALLLRRRKA